MRVFPDSGKVVLLVVVLLAVCYIADWTDDYCSYSVAAQYTAFDTANGHRPAISGGSAGSSLMLAALRSSAKDQTPSAMDAVFGRPSGSGGDDMSSRMARSSNAFDRFGRSSDGLGTSLSSRGLSMSLSGSSVGFSGSTLGTGASSTGSGLGGGSTLGGLSSFGPQ